MAPISPDRPPSPAANREDRIGPEPKPQEPEVEAEAVKFPRTAGVSGKSSLTGAGWTDNGIDGRQQVTALRADFVKGRIITPEQLLQLSLALSYDLFTDGRVLPPLMPGSWAPGKNSAERGALTFSVRNIVSLGQGFFVQAGARSRVVALGQVTGKDLDPSYQAGQSPLLGTVHGAELSVWQRIDPATGYVVESGAGGGLDVPVGPAAFGAIRGWAQTGVSTPQGIRLEVGIQGTLPWMGNNNFYLPTQNEVVISPYGEVAYEDRTIKLSLKGEGRALVTDGPLFTLNVTYKFF